MEFKTITNKNGAHIYFKLDESSKIIGRSLTNSNIGSGKSNGVDHDLHFGRPFGFLYDKLKYYFDINREPKFFEFKMNDENYQVELSISDNDHVQINFNKIKEAYHHYIGNDNEIMDDVAIFFDFKNLEISFLKEKEIAKKYPYTGNDYRPYIVDILLDDKNVELKTIYDLIVKNMDISTHDKNWLLENDTEPHYLHKVRGCLNTLKKNGEVINDAKTAIWNLAVSYNEEIDEDIKKIISNSIKDMNFAKNVSPEEEEAYILSKIKHRNPRLQKAFRKHLVDEFNSKCAICDINDSKLLIASHIIACKDCVKEDGTVDVDIIFNSDNGLLLCPNHDALFDKKYISFDQSGKIEISDRITKNIKLCEYLDLNKDILLEEKYLTEERKKCLDNHILIDKESEEK